MHRHEHVVQLYGSDERLLARNVCRYLAEGFARGEGLILIATPQHTEAFASGLAECGLDVPRIVSDGRLAVFDAEAMLGRLMVDGMPDPQRFDDVVARELETVRRRSGSADVTAYGEMVGILWSAGQVAAAERLEALWNATLERGGLRLFCAYAIDLLGQGWDSGAVTPIFASHSATLPAGDEFESALSRAMADVLGPDAEPLRRRLEAAGSAGVAAGTALAAALVAERHARAREILDRARYYQHSRPIQA
jgi:hypothetical protein